MPSSDDSPPAAGKAGRKKRTSDFEKVSGVENLYYRRSRGVYVTRVSLNQTRTWKSLETDVLTVAKLRHRKEQEENEKARQSGARISGEFRTLGELANEFLKRTEAASLAASSVVGYKGHVKRLRENWRRGSFDSYPVKRVTPDLIFELRDYLSKEAVVRHGRIGVCTTRTQGYGNTVVNDTLLCLRRLIDIAIEERVMIQSPFFERTVLRERINLPALSKKPALPDRLMMDRLFAQIRGVTVADQDRRPHPLHQSCAEANANFAEFLAYSGARHEEANLVRVGYYKPGVSGRVGTLYVPGYKSVSSDRTIPVIPPLKRLLDRLVAGRDREEKLLKATTCLRPLQRACAHLGAPRLTQHHLRHYFATICIEKGVDIPTVSRWLGHSDGGRLAMKTYGHLRTEHSLAQAALVDFGDDRTTPIKAPLPSTEEVVLFKPDSGAQSKTG